MCSVLFNRVSLFVAIFKISASVTQKALLAEVHYLKSFEDPLKCYLDRLLYVLPPSVP